MDQHFCTCIVIGCKNHPRNHAEGCDLCILKNLKSGEVPACFWLQISDDLSGYKKYTYENFSDFFKSIKKNIIRRKIKLTGVRYSTKQDILDTSCL